MSGKREIDGSDGVAGAIQGTRLILSLSPVVAYKLLE